MKSVVIRGVSYPSQTDAARALGVSRAAIHQAKRRGKLDGVGLKPAAASVTINGFEYPSMKAAAKAMGVTRSAIWQARAKGTLDFVGERKGQESIMSSEYLKDARQSLGLTQAEMARLTGYGAVARWSELERGVRQPSAGTIRLVRAYLDGYRPDDWPA